MEATSVYPNSAPVLAVSGLGVALAGIDPDQVPLEPDLVNDARRRFAPGGSAVDACGVMRLHVRNALGYAFLRPHQRDKLRLVPTERQRAKEKDWRAQINFFRSNYRHFVPPDLLMDYLQHECPPQEDGYCVSKWQGNGIAGVDCGQDGHVVFYPTGHVLQQACAWYSKGDSDEDPPCSSTVIETGSPIHQFAVMGGKDAYHSTSTAKIYAAARGTTNCTIVAAPARVAPEKMHKMQAKAKISFQERLNHVAGSPHAEAEVALVTYDGVIRYWEPEGGTQTASKLLANTPNRWLRCEYSSHPRILWAVNRATLSTLDLRQPSQDSNALFDVANSGSLINIYDVKRRSSNPFQFVVGTSVSVELLDSRMARRPLVSWKQPPSYTGTSELSFGAIDEVSLSRNANDERGYIVSSSMRPKVTTVFPFERNRKRKRSKVFCLILQRSGGDDEYSEAPRTSIEQLVASDATLDLHMEDGGEQTHLTGICALRDEDGSSARIYQLNSLGDLYSHRVSCSRSTTKPYRSAVQPDLPCGVTAQDDPADQALPRTLPIPLDAILPEIDTESMQMFSTLPIKVLRRQFPRLPNVDKPIVASEAHGDHEEQEDHEAEPTPITTKSKKKPVKLEFPLIGRRLPLSLLKKIEEGAENSDQHETSEDDSAEKTIVGKRIPRSWIRKEENEPSVPAEGNPPMQPENNAGALEETPSTGSGTKRSRSFDEDELADKLLRVCNPSASLFRLHRYVLDKLEIELSSSELLRRLRSNRAFSIRTVHHVFPADTLLVRNPSAPGADNVHRSTDDPRVATCTCRPGSPRSQVPCESLSCVVPHAVIVSDACNDFRLDDSAPSSAVRQKMPDDFADIITAAETVYDDMYESE